MKTCPVDTKNPSAVRVRHGEVIMTFGEKNTAYYCIQEPTGIHARPAGALAKLAKGFASEITLSANGKKAAANSIIDMMSLGAKQGTTLMIEAHGEDAPKALEAMLAFLREHL